MATLVSDAASTISQTRISIPTAFKRKMTRLRPLAQTPGVRLKRVELRLELAFQETLRWMHQLQKSGREDSLINVLCTCWSVNFHKSNMVIEEEISNELRYGSDRKIGTLHKHALTCL